MKIDTRFLYFLCFSWPYPIQTSIKAQPKEKQKMKKDEMKKEKIEFLV